jgi:WD40 repeat protein
VFAPDGTTVATAGGSTVRLWEPYGEPRLRGIHRMTGAATSVSFDPTGKLLASGGADGTVVVQRARGGPVRTLTVGSPVIATSWARTGVLLAAGRDGSARLYPGGGADVSRTISNGSQLVGADLRRDGAVVATAGSDGIVRIWNARTGSPIRELPQVTNLTAVALDPTGRLIATASANSVLVYAAATGKLLATLARHTDAVTGLAFSPTGRRLASSSKDHDAWLWDMRTLKPIKRLHGHTAFVSGVAFSPDGRWLATAGPAKAGVWSVGESSLPGSFLHFVRGNTAPMTSVAFSARGWELATAARDGSIRVFDCKLCGRLPQLKSTARARLASLHR